MTQRYNMESICSVNQLMQKGNLFSNGLESEQNDQLIMPLLHLITGATMVPNAFGYREDYVLRVLPYLWSLSNIRPSIQVCDSKTFFLPV